MLRKFIVSGAIAFVALQLVRPGISDKPASAELNAPAEVRRVFEKNCYSCHSDQRRLSWFDQVVPAYWLVRHDVLTAREHLNFSTLGAKPAAVQKATLYEAVNMVRLGAMPLPSFLRLHPEAKVTREELETVKAYLAPWPLLPKVGSPTLAAAESAPAPLAPFKPELNGLPFDATFRNWKTISTTDRGDNNTFRFILGNDIAIKAAQTGSISPWPNGARLAKIAWQQAPGADGLVHPGKFIQVELMIKDAKRYKDVEGWGWGRWRGLDLQPYGQNAQFVNECTSCHLPLRGNDYVYTLPISSAKIARPETLNNAAAQLSAALPFQPLGWTPITLYVDPKNQSTATLYGNNAANATGEARRAAAANDASAPGYRAGAVLALVTWAQREDPHWFGARIPATPQSVEFVEVAADAKQNRYRRFAGIGLAQSENSPDSAPRTRFILDLAPVQLP